MIDIVLLAIAAASYGCGISPSWSMWVAFNRTQEPLLGRCGVVDARPCITGLATARHSVNCCVLLVGLAGQRGDCYRGGDQGGRAPSQMHRLPLSRFQ